MNGDAHGRRDHVFIYRLAKQMTPAQLAEAQKRTADWQAAFERRQAD